MCPFGDDSTGRGAAASASLRFIWSALPVPGSAPISSARGFYGTDPGVSRGASGQHYLLIHRLIAYTMILQVAIGSYYHFLRFGAKYCIYPH